MSIKLNGRIDEFFETGCEGLCWMFFDESKEGYYAQLVEIEEGDYLRIFADDGSILFEGEIRYDCRAGWEPYPRGKWPRWILLLLKRLGFSEPPYGQPTALGYWIHWTQRGWTPEDWMKLFIRRWEGLPPYRAELTKKSK